MKRKWREKFDSADALVILGLALYGGGVWWLCPPVSLATVGLIVFVMGVNGSKV